jgi:hypothetical protein
VDYAFLEGRTFDVNGQIYVVDSLSNAGGKVVVEAWAWVGGEHVLKTFPAELATQALVADEEIELRGVSFR